MTDKLIESAVHILESKRRLIFDVSGVAAYVLVAAAWSCLDAQFEKLPVAVTFFKALTMLATGYWGVFSFAKITYSCTKKRGVLLGGLMAGILLIENKILFMYTDESIVGGAIRSMGMLGGAGGILGWLLAWSSKGQEQA